MIVVSVVKAIQCPWEVSNLICQSPRGFLLQNRIFNINAQNQTANILSQLRETSGLEHVLIVLFFFPALATTSTILW